MTHCLKTHLLHNLEQASCKEISCATNANHLYDFIYGFHVVFWLSKYCLHPDHTGALGKVHLAV